MIIQVRMVLGLVFIIANVVIVYALHRALHWRVHRVKGMTTLEIQRIPVVAIEGAAEGDDCAVCLERISDGQPARVLPLCRHTFHVPCADAWLARNGVCPLCRAKLTVGSEQMQPQQNC